MLYDNALLVAAYLEACQATGDPYYRRIVEETLDYVLREMTDPAGAVLLDPGRRQRGRGGQVLRLVAGRGRDGPRPGVGPTSSARLRRHRRAATGRGTTSCTGRGTGEQAAQLAEPRRPTSLRAKLAEGRAQALRRRGRRRVWPGRDEKILTAWNGLMIAAFAAGRGGLRRSRGTRPPQSAPPTSCWRTSANRTAGCSAPRPSAASPSSTATWKTTPS